MFVSASDSFLDANSPGNYYVFFSDLPQRLLIWQIS